MTRWVLGIASESRIVDAPTEWDALDTLRNEPLDTFGLIVTAQQADLDADTDPILFIYPDVLFERWGMHETAARFRAVHDAVLRKAEEQRVPRLGGLRDG